MVGTLRKLVWVFEFWNEMLVSDIRCKNLLKSSSFRKFLLEFWEESGEKLMTCHLFLDNFSWIFMTFCSPKVKSFETNFCFKKTRISRFRYHESVRLFWILSFVKDVFIAENWLCFRACNSRIVTCDQEFCHVEWLLCFLNHCYGIFSLKSFPKGIMVLSKTSVRFRNRIFKRFE